MIVFVPRTTLVFSRFTLSTIDFMFSSVAVRRSISFCFEGIEGESLLLLLDEKEIYASSGSACASGSLDPSHVLLALGRPHEIAHGSLRLSINEELTDADVDKIIADVTEVVTYLRGISPIWRDMVEGRKEFVIK